jgi:starch synthase
MQTGTRGPFRPDWQPRVAHPLAVDRRPSYTTGLEVDVHARRILMVSPEAVPFAKTGGLGDVAGALPLALARLGHDVTLVLPRYRGAFTGTEIDRMRIPMTGRLFDVTFVEHALGDRVRAVLVDCPELYDRPELYGHGNSDYPDNAVRFAVLSRAALEFAARPERAPDVVHAHDWQAGLTPVYLETLFRDRAVLASAGRVFTIHNLAYQGLFPPVWMPALDLGWELFGVDGIEFWGKLSFLKAGINFSEYVTTVSPRYGKEIQTPQYGFGFDGILQRRSKQLCGILNGIDVRVWNPAVDRYLPKPYTPETLDDKQASKRALLERVGLPFTEDASKRPVVGLVSRLVDQKGFDLLAALGADLRAMDATFVLLGTGEARYQEIWQRFAEEQPARVAVRFGFDESLAHLIEAGADIFLMPSQFEPCGLNQMYSLKYGTVPVVRAVGGLDDTIEDWNPKTKAGTGFKFRDYTPAALKGSLERALALYRSPKLWRDMQLKGMAKDHSWDASAAEYVKVYERAIKARNRRPPA